MGGAKVPGLEVKTQKGVSKHRERKEEIGEKAENKVDSEEIWIQGRKEASKRYRSREAKEEGHHTEIENKRQRTASPRIERKEGEHQKEGKVKLTSFLQVLMASRYQQPKPPDPDGTRTPVRKKIQRYEDKTKPLTSAKRKRGTGGQGRQPSPLREERSQTEAS